MHEDVLSPVIHFSGLGGEYGAFSNFAPYPITLRGKHWPTSEHYFQAMKFAGTPREEEIRQAKTPKAAANLGRSRAYTIRADWEQFKEKVMYEALRAKFTQHTDLHAMLLGTREAHLVEHRAKDAYWGDAGDGSGRNRLGVLLMRLRAELWKSARID
jgi:ribA/ribD-fused uncharacterized protein